VLGQAEQLGYAVLELSSQHVVGIISKAVIAESNIGGVIANFPAPSSEFLQPDILDSGARQSQLQRLAIEMRQPSRHGK